MRNIIRDASDPKRCDCARLRLGDRQFESGLLSHAVAMLHALGVLLKTSPRVIHLLVAFQDLFFASYTSKRAARTPRSLSRAMSLRADR